ncbi:MAG: mannonate dehydratase [Candidatus Latescibacterota bacterium]|nr:mannonate dehydratase [Candidatus Latescibacterota bacterium]
MRPGKFKLSMTLGRSPSDHPEKVQICREMGVSSCVTAPDLHGIGRDQYEAAMRYQKEEWEEVGFALPVYETMTPVKGDHIRRGTSGREEEIKNYIAAIEAMGRAGIPVLCYNLGAGGSRTDWVPTRGGAISSQFDYARSNAEEEPFEEPQTEEELWDNLTWLLERIVPVAEKAKVRLGYHPNDPPISPYRGSAQIMVSADAYRRLFNIAPSPNNGVTFCQGNFKAMGEDIYSVAREFTEQGKVHFIHYRDVEGTADARFTETFHDDGPTDMARMLEIYSHAGFDGPIRPDHAPTMGSEDAETTRGYGTLGKIFAFGYMIGLMQAQSLVYE